MSYLKELIEKRDAALTKASTAAELASTEKRALTVEEDTEIAAALKLADELDPQIVQHTDLEARALAATKAREVAGISTAALPTTKVNSEPRTYMKGAKHGFVADAFAAQFMGDQEAMQRQARHMTEDAVERRAIGTAAVSGLVVPQYLVELAAPLARAGRPIADMARHVDLPEAGMKAYISKVTTGTSVATQAAEGDAVSETNLDDTLLEVSVVTAAGQQTISRQAVERGTGVTGIIEQDLIRAYHTDIDKKVVAEIVASAGTTVAYTDASPTVAELYPKLANAFGQTFTDEYAAPNFIGMTPLRFAWFLQTLDTTNRPLIVPNGTNSLMQGDKKPEYGNTGYSLFGVPIVADGNILTNTGAGVNQDEIYFGQTQELFLWEDPSMPLMLRFDQVFGAKLQILAVVYGYVATTANRRPKAFAKIAGTGLTTPVFA